MSKLTRSFVALLAVSALMSVGAAAIGKTTTPTKSKGKKDSGTAYVATTYSSGGYTYAAGNSKDKILGTGAVTYKNKITSGPKTGTLKVTVKSVTAFTGTGSLSGTGTATLTVSTSGAATGTGKFSLTKGTGSQHGHSLSGKYTITGNTVTGRYTFKYTGFYK